MFPKLSNIILAGTIFGSSSQLEQNASSTWLSKTFVIGGSAIIFSYAGYRLWQSIKDSKGFNSFTQKKFIGNEPTDCSAPGVTGNKDREEKEMSDVDFEIEDDFTLPVGALWADICPDVTEEVEVDALYQLPVRNYEENEKTGEKKVTVWGLEVIEEQEEE